MADTPVVVIDPVVENDAALQAQVQSPEQALASFQQKIVAGNAAQSGVAPGVQVPVTVQDVPAPLQTAPMPSVIDTVNSLGGQSDVQKTIQSLEKGAQLAGDAEARKPLTPEQFIQTPEGQKAAASGGADGFNSAYSKYFDQMMRADATLGKAASETAKFQAAQLGELAKQQQEWQKQEAKQQFERQAQIEAEKQQLQQVADEFKAASTATVDPGKFWNQMTEGTGGKIMTGIALALGAIGGGYSGKGGNVAVDIINKAIDRDIDAQKANIANRTAAAKGQFDMQNSLYGRMLEKFKNEDMAEAATRLLYTQQIELQIKQKAAELSGTEALMNAQKAVAITGMKKQELARQFEQASMMKNLLGNSGQIPPEAVGMLPKEYQDRYVPGYGFAPNQASATKFQEKRAEIQPAIDGVDRIMALTKDFNRVTDQTKRAQILTEMKALAGQLRVPLTGPGAMTEKEYERLMDTIGDPTSMTSIRKLQEARLQQVRKKLSSDLDSSAKQYGFSTKTFDASKFTPNK